MVWVDLDVELVGPVLENVYAAFRHTSGADVMFAEDVSSDRAA